MQVTTLDNLSHVTGGKSSPSPCRLIRALAPPSGRASLPQLAVHIGCDTSLFLAPLLLSCCDRGCIGSQRLAKRLAAATPDAVVAGSFEDVLTQRIVAVE
jgi:hypothetical protein